MPEGLAPLALLSAGAGALTQSANGTEFLSRRAFPLLREPGDWIGGNAIMNSDPRS
jgi:hypothetical protein